MAKSIEPEVKNWFAQALSQHKTKYCIEQRTLNVEIENTQDTFITSNIPIAVYPTSKAKKVAIWLPLSSHIGIIFSGNKKHKRNNLVDSANKTETLNFLVANNANLYYQKTALLIGNNKRCLTKAYDIVSSPNFGLSDL